MAQAILTAVDAGKDPFVTNLFGDSPHFARERAFLKKDNHVYHEDVRRGRQWLVQLPEGPPTSAMLLLQEPRSLLWKYWSRHDTTAPAGGSYLLLAVNWGKGNWVISTDPVQRLGIKGLAEALQAAEARKDAHRPHAGGGAARRIAAGGRRNSFHHQEMGQGTFGRRSNPSCQKNRGDRRRSGADAGHQRAGLGVDAAAEPPRVAAADFPARRGAGRQVR